TAATDVTRDPGPRHNEVNELAGAVGATTTSRRGGRDEDARRTAGPRQARVRQTRARHPGARQPRGGPRMRPLPLTPAKRSEALEASGTEGHELDVLVIGGGVTGAGIALDAVTRGLRVGIVEAQDWGSGTSSRSSKLVHGGLRYLQMLDFHLVHEALTERDL